MAVSEVLADFKPPEREDALRMLVACFVALVFHVLLFRVLMFETPDVYEVKEDIIAVEIVTLPPSVQKAEPVKQPSEIKDAPLPPPPKVSPRPKPTPPSTPTISTQVPDIIASSRTATAEDAGNTVPLSDAGGCNTKSYAARTLC